jgi:hypothetical protein
MRLPDEGFDRDIPADIVKGRLHGQKVFIGELLACHFMASDLDMRDRIAKYKWILLHHFATFVYARRETPVPVDSELRASPQTKLKGMWRKVELCPPASDN